jgi:hypothetical protein
MSFTTSELFSVDGVTLNTWAYNIQSKTGRFNLPAAKIQNLSVPGRDGEIYQPNKSVEATDITLKMWVRGTDVDGNVPLAGYARTFRTNMDTIARLFGKRNNVLTLTQTMPDGSQRRCTAEVVEAVSFDVHAVNPIAIGDVKLKNLSGVWEDVNSISQQILPVVSGTIYNLTSFLGATAPMKDLLLTLMGPATNALIDDPNTGISVQYNAILPALNRLFVDSSKWEAAVELTRVDGVIVHTGHPRLFVLTPPITGTAPQIRVTGTGFTSATALTVAGRRKYFTP